MGRIVCYDAQTIFTGCFTREMVNDKTVGLSSLEIQRRSIQNCSKII
nr:MAG TPA: hypothetical protein [Caudoviricetes sp.]DAX10764.1 MAG TPA: hypothetical protein [Bacteriophage sp.]